MNGNVVVKGLLPAPFRFSCVFLPEVYRRKPEHRSIFHSNFVLDRSGSLVRGKSALVCVPTPVIVN